jgi:hypothetical protein
MANMGLEVRDFMTAMSWGQQFMNNAEDQRMQQQQFTESMARAKQTREFEAQRQPLDIDLLRKQLEHQRLVINKAEQILPYEVENARLGNIKTQADIQHTEMATKLTSQNISNAAYQLNVLKEGAESRRAKDALEAAQAKASLEILPQTQQAALAKAQEAVMNLEDKQSDDLASSNILLQKKTGSDFYETLRRYPQAEKLYKNPDGSWLQEDSIKKELNDFTSSRVRNVATQQYIAKWQDKGTTSTAAIKNAEAYVSNMARANQGDKDAAVKAGVIARSVGIGDLKDITRQINLAYMSGQEIPEGHLMLLVANSTALKGDPAAMYLLNQLSKDPQYAASFHNVTQMVQNANRLSSGVNLESPTSQVTSQVWKDGKQYPVIPPEQVDQFLQTAVPGTYFLGTDGKRYQVPGANNVR